MIYSESSSLFYACFLRQVSTVQLLQHSKSSLMNWDSGTLHSLQTCAFYQHRLEHITQESGAARETEKLIFQLGLRHQVGRVPQRDRWYWWSNLSDADPARIISKFAERAPWNEVTRVRISFHIKIIHVLCIHWGHIWLLFPMSLVPMISYLTNQGVPDLRKNTHEHRLLKIVIWNLAAWYLAKAYARTGRVCEVALPQLYLLA